MFKHINIMAGISGIAISICTLSITASANPKIFTFEGQMLVSAKKLIKYRIKADQFADDAEAFAKQAKTNAAKLEDCCSEFPEADEAREYAKKAKEAANSARDRANRANKTKKTSKAEDLKNKAKDFALQAEDAAENAKTALNDVLKSKTIKKEFIPRVTAAINIAESSAKEASEAVNSAIDCCSEQKIDGDISDIKDAEDAANEAAKAASEAISASESFEVSKSYSDVKKYTIEVEFAAERAAEAASQAVRSANLVKRYPDDFSDLMDNCRIGNNTIKNYTTRKVRYKGNKQAEFWEEYCRD